MTTTDAQPEVRYSAFVAKGRLCILGVADTACGPVPLASYAEITGDCEDGPVGVDAPDNVKSAMDTALIPIQKQMATATMHAGAESLVLRARSRDQNAMAIIALIGEQARAGNGRARVAAQLIEDYCKSNTSMGVTIGEDDDNTHPVLTRIVNNRSPMFAYPLALATYLSHAPPDMRTVVCLANGPRLTKDRILEIASRLANDEESHAFLSGIERAHDTEFKVDDEIELFRAGRMLGQARAIQVYRINGKIARFCEDSAWEMGE